MIKQIVGGVVVLVIGGTSYTIHQSDVSNNLSKNTGMTQQQAQDYVNNIPKDQLESFSKIGQDLSSDGNSVNTEMNKIDCANYTYQWVTPTLSCDDGKTQMQAVGSNEITLGGCFEELDTDLGSTASAKINECLADIDTLNSAYDAPIVSVALDSKTINDTKTTLQYDKSVLQAALQSK